MNETLLYFLSGNGDGAGCFQSGETGTAHRAGGTWVPFIVGVHLDS